jgi:arylsulfatase A-like enzyme
MNVVLIVVDSLRACSLNGGGGLLPTLPFLRDLGREATHFRRAYATECWTLPSHCSMFTGLLPSQHGAHFHTMAYTNKAPTIAELLSQEGIDTEIVTRNFVFDGTIPGVNRGFRRHTQLLSVEGPLNPFALLLGVTKPRFRRHVRSTGFFHPLHQDNRSFLTTFARAMMPADRLSLDYILERMTAHRRDDQNYFFFANLYDVHAPYPPTEKSILRSFRSLQGLVENVSFPYFISRLGAHTYLKPGFRLSESGRRLLLGRYHTSITLMDAKLRDFYQAARDNALLEDTVVIITSDHGEAFGDHGLYLHDASVYETHLHVPLWVYWPGRSAEVVDDIVSTRDLFGLIRNAALGGNAAGTILDAGYRQQHPIALAEHFYYPHAKNMDARYKQNITAAIGGTHKVIRRREGLVAYDVGEDPEETRPTMTSIETVAAEWSRRGIQARSIEAVAAHLEAWQVG